MLERTARSGSKCLPEAIHTVMQSAQLLHRSAASHSNGLFWPLAMSMLTEPIILLLRKQWVLNQHLHPTRQGGKVPPCVSRHGANCSYLMQWVSKYRSVTWVGLSLLHHLQEDRPMIEQADYCVAEQKNIHCNIKKGDAAKWVYSFTHLATAWIQVAPQVPRFIYGEK